MKIYHVELILWQKISNWTHLVIISFSSAVRVAKRSKNIFVGFSEMLKKIFCEKLDFVKNCFHIFPWTNVKER